MHTCFDLVGSRQHGVVSYEIFSWSTDIHILTKMVMTSDETQIQILANWPMSHAKRLCLSAVTLSRQRHDILDFSNCPLSRVLHVTWRKSRIDLFLPHGCTESDKGFTTTGRSLTIRTRSELRSSRTAWSTKSAWIRADLLFLSFTANGKLMNGSL